MAIVPAVERIKTYLDAGLNLIQARAEDKKTEGLDDWVIDVKGKQVQIFNENDFPDDFFSPENEGKVYFNNDRLARYPHLPANSIITSDGTVYALTKDQAKHYEYAAWLKYNGVNLRDSIRIRYFPPSENKRVPLLSVIANYDHDTKTNENNFAKLCEIWFEKYEYGSTSFPVELTTQQAKAMYIMGKRWGMQVEQIFNPNPALCIDPAFAITNQQRSVGRENDKTLTRAMNRMTSEELFVSKDPRIVL